MTFKKKLGICLAFLVAFLLFGSAIVTSAIKIEDSDLEKDSYELPSGSRFDYSTSSPTASMSYGANEAGDLYLIGAVDDGITSFLGTPACSVDSGTISFVYDFNNATLLEGNVDKWVVNSSSENMVAGYSTANAVGKGAAIVLKSTNGSSWFMASAQTDFLTSAGEKTVYTATEQELTQGTYYRIIIAYEIRHRTKEAGWWFWEKEENEYKQCIEVIDVYATYTSDPVTFVGIVDGENVSTETLQGFRVDKNGSTNLVKVQTPDGTVVTAKDKDVFYKKGTYEITTTTKLNVKRTTTITVTEGLDLSSASANIYESANNTGYIADSSTKTESPSATNGGYTTLYVATVQGSTLKKLPMTNYDVFGITGSGVYLFLELKEENLKDEWSISQDTWGKYDGEFVSGIQTGEIKTGALTLRKSSDGINWQLCATGSYKDGVFTTDYQASYSTNGMVCVYIPSGTDVLNAIYLNISYAYEVNNASTGTTRNVVESYVLAICSDEVDSVTFHNLTNKDSFGDGIEDEAMLDIIKKSETLINGSVTTTGFEVDKSLNPTVDISILKDGEPYAIPFGNKITEPGKYIVNLSSKVGTMRQIVIYICDFTEDEIHQEYFDGKFLEGKRIFRENSSIPVYEGGSLKYHIAELNDKYPVLFGYILNETTGEKYNIRQSKAAQNAVIEDPGIYKAVYNLNETFALETPSGDNYVITFNFEVIAKGTAPGPVVNQQNLNEYTFNHNPSNSYPVFYGVTYSSASKGNITLAFVDHKSAYEFAYNYEKGMVEVQEDGSYRYLGSLLVSQKVKYESNWDLTDAIHYFAEQSVQRLCFDMSDDFTYTTLSQDIIDANANLRILELSHSVIIFAEGQAEALLSKNTLPILNSKKYSYVVPGIEDVTEKGYNVFKFVKDKNGYDSNSIIIIDANGRTYDIEYNKSVEEQLIEYGCPTGVVTIIEKTIYGDGAEYQAVYLSPNDVTTELNLEEYLADGKKQVTINQSNDGQENVVRAFSLMSIKDELDPFALVKIKHDMKEYFFAIDEVKEEFWSEIGEYEITVVNRLGNSYTYKLKIEEPYYYSINIDGADDGSNKIIYKDGEMVNLPVLEKYGYNFVGYKVPNGSVYKGEIASIMLKGISVVEVVWEAKKYQITLKTDDEIYEVIDVEFGGEYVLPVLKSTETMEFAGWSIADSEPVKTLTVEKEGNAIMTACYKPKTTIPDTDDNGGSGSGTVDDGTDGDTNSDTGSGEIAGGDQDNTDNNDANNNNKVKRKRIIKAVDIVLLVIAVMALFAPLVIAIIKNANCNATFLHFLIAILTIIVVLAVSILIFTFTPMRLWVIMAISLLIEIIGSVITLCVGY